jgi:LPXTG-site transpeptidase (sortase) family protein
VAFFVVFFLFCVFLFVIDFVPESPGSTLPGSSSDISQATAGSQQQYPEENPVRIQAPAVGIDALVNDPSSTDVNVLDNSLSSGAVHYPASGLLGDTSRMYIFGHQSYLPIVHNQAYKTFNGLQNLKIGDEIIVYSATAAYHYRVFSVQQVTAAAGTVSLGGNDRMLTLSTCDSFGTKEDRYEVEAQFVSRSLLTPNNS